jgi:hypothetical protein
MNVRHVSLSNVFNLSRTTGDSFSIQRNINCISLNNSLSYSIKNLNISMGAFEIESDITIGLPLRFYLSDDPINQAIQNYTTTEVIFNNLVNPTTYDYNQLDISDSSNISFNNSLNLFQTEEFPFYMNLKTNTVFETYLNQLVRSKYYYSLTGVNYNFSSIPTITNDFSFKSNNESNLAIAIFPFGFPKPVGGTFLINCQYTINFDLIEESL